MKLQLSKFDKIIFDMDGVITSENAYWEAAVLTVYELLYSYRYYGRQDIDREWCRKNLNLIYDTILCGGQTIDAVKKTGVNTNWDLAYVIFCISKYLEPDMTGFNGQHFESVCMFIENIELKPPELYVALEGLAATAVGGKPGDLKRGGSRLWQEILDCFQAWYHGTDCVAGVKENERPLMPLEDIKCTLGALKEKGIKLGIGTGRPTDEIIYPLKPWGLTEYFEPKLFAAYDQVVQAENDTKSKEPLAKPHPFVFLKAAFGDEFSDEELLGGAVTPEMAERCLVVGDAPSDLMSALAGGFKFAAVLTGISGSAARPYFEENHADIILDSVLDLREDNGD